MSLKDILYYKHKSDSIDGFENLGNVTNPFIINYACVFMLRGLTEK